MTRTRSQGVGGQAPRAPREQAAPFPEVGQVAPHRVLKSAPASRSPEGCSTPAGAVAGGGGCWALPRRDARSLAQASGRRCGGLTEALPHRGAERVPQEELHLGRTARQGPERVSRRVSASPAALPARLTLAPAPPSGTPAPVPAPPRHVTIGRRLPCPLPIGPYTSLSESPPTLPRPIGRGRELGHRNLRHLPWPASERKSVYVDSPVYWSIEGVLTVIGQKTSQSRR